MASLINLSNDAFFSVLLDALTEAVTMVNREGIVVRWNKAAAKLYGISENEILGRRIGDFFQRGSLMLFQVMETGLPVFGVYHQPRPDKHVFIHTVPVLNEVSELIGAVSIEQDITDVVRLSEEKFSQQMDNHDVHLSPVLDSSHRGLQKTLKFIEQMRTVDKASPLLITGEPGVGKAILARHVHTQSHLNGPFMVVDCDVLPDGYLDIELFGHQSDIFADSTQEKIGKLELANQGTLFLMNVESMPEKTQIKLAKAIQGGGFTKNGGSKRIPLNCHLIGSCKCGVALSNHDGRILPELYYQFHAVEIPPIRKRREDLPSLCHHYLSEAAKRLGKTVPQLSSEVMAALTTYPWPGNIPELNRAMEHLVIVSTEDFLTLHDLPRAIRPKTVNEITQSSMPLASLSEEMERTRIEDALAQTGGNKASTARLLGISRGTLYYKLRQYNMD